MDREILFRGKVADEPDEWVQGYLRDADTIFQQTRHAKSKCCDYGFFSVKPDTVGQYTGLTDKNGTKIFEGDVVKDEFGRIMKVLFKDNWCKFQFELIKITGSKWTNNFRYADLTDWFSDGLSEKPEIIGNIHDNPGLIGGEK